MALLHERELPELRTITGKTFALPNGRRRFTAGLAPVHFEDGEGNLAEISVGFAEEKDRLVSDQIGCRVVIDPRRVGYRYESRRGRAAAEVRVLSLGDAAPEARECRNEGKVVWWLSAAPGIDVGVEARPGGASLLRRLHTPEAARECVWEILTEGADDGLIFDIESHGFDNADLNAERFPKDRQWKAETTHTIEEDRRHGEWRRVRVRDVWTGRVAERDPETRVLRWSEAVAYPVVIDPTVNESIGSNADDGFEDVNAATWSTGNLNRDFAGLGPNYNQPTHSGFRFTTVAVPQAATIDTATLTLTISDSGYIGGSGHSMIVVGDDVDSAAAWSSSSRPSQITDTSATVGANTWVVGANAIDVKTIVQEIVNRAGWASGNDMRIALRNTKGAGTGTAWVGVWDYSHGSSFATLDITYSTGGGGNKKLLLGAGV